jgi:hypothetical protein
MTRHSTHHQKVFTTKYFLDSKQSDDLPTVLCQVTMENNKGQELTLGCFRRFSWTMKASLFLIVLGSLYQFTSGQQSVVTDCGMSVQKSQTLMQNCTSTVTLLASESESMCQLYKVCADLMNTNNVETDLDRYCKPVNMTEEQKMTFMAAKMVLAVSRSACSKDSNSNYCFLSLPKDYGGIVGDQMCTTCGRRVLSELIKFYDEMAQAKVNAKTGNPWEMTLDSLAVKCSARPSQSTTATPQNFADTHSPTWKLLLGVFVFFVLS